MAKQNGAADCQASGVPSLFSASDQDRQCRQRAVQCRCRLDLLHSRGQPISLPAPSSALVVNRHVSIDHPLHIKRSQKSRWSTKVGDVAAESATTMFAGLVGELQSQLVANKHHGLRLGQISSGRRSTICRLRLTLSKTDDHGESGMRRAMLSLNQRHSEQPNLRVALTSVAALAVLDRRPPSDWRLAAF